MLVGVTVEYEVSEVADRNAGIVAKIPKKYLPEPSADAREMGTWQLNDAKSGS